METIELSPTATKKPKPKTPKPNISDTYRNSAAARSDKAALRSLADRLKFPAGAVVVDECGTYVIAGRSAMVTCYSNREGWLGKWLVITSSGKAGSTAKALKGQVKHTDGEGYGGIVMVDDKDLPIDALRAILLAR